MFILSTLKFIVLLLIAVLALAIVVIFVKLHGSRTKLKASSTLKFFKKLQLSNGKYREVIYHREIIHKKWEELSERIKVGDERSLRLCIIEADNLVDEILIIHGHPGKDMGERLKSIYPAELKYINELWEAHKIRNQIAHDSDFHLPPDLAKKTINTYHNVLEDLSSKELELV